MIINGQLHGNYMLKIRTRITTNDPRIIVNKIYENRRPITWKLYVKDINKGLILNSYKECVKVSCVEFLRYLASLVPLPFKGRG